jgi:hypothetical protein
MIYDIIKIILYNLFFISLLYYDKRIGILIIILLILYWIKINSLIKNKVVEGFDLYFRDIFYMPDFDLDQIGFGSVLPNRAQYNSDYRGSSTTYSFFKGGGQSNVIKSGNISLYQETEKLLKELTEFLENKKDNCLGSFKRGKCSKKCGYGEQKVTYELFDENMDDSKCEHKNGDTYYDECFLKPCDNEKPCKSDFDCRSNNCLNGICSTLFDCGKNQFLDNCKTKEDCLYLNERYDKEKFKYTWDGVKCNQDDKYTYSGSYDTESNNEDISVTDGIKFKKVSGIGKPETSGPFIPPSTSTTPPPPSTPTPRVYIFDSDSKKSICTTFEILLSNQNLDNYCKQCKSGMAAGGGQGHDFCDNCCIKSYY